MKTQLKTYGMQQKWFLEGSLYQNNPTSRKRKVSNRQPNFTPKVTGKEKEEEQQQQISRTKYIIKIRAEIIEKEMKETIININKSKSWFFEKINKIDKPLGRLIKKKKREE